MDVVSGRIVAGKPVRLACERHLRDIERQTQLGLRFDIAMAQHYILFFEQLLSIEVENQVRPFVLHPFQRFIVGSLFGWMNGDGTRRFRTAYIEMGKGSGKSPLAAGIGLAGLLMDGQVSPEIYSAAVTREQAQILWKDALAMVERSEELKQIIETRVGSLYFGDNRGVFRPVSSEHRGLDGKRVHMALIDEIHEHPTDLVVNKMRAGTKARRNALIFEITNSGSDLESVCWHHHEYSLKVLEGVMSDSSWFAYVCSLDDGDDWHDESTWLKVNPGLGSILPVQYLREQVREAEGMPSKQNIVKRLNFCIWTQQHELWIPIEDWEACKDPIDQDSLLHQPCWVGVDLSDKIDLSVMVLVFKKPVREKLEIEINDHSVKDEEGKPIQKHMNIDFSVDLVPYFFIPEETMYAREKEDMVPYSLWAEQGFLFPTPGAIIDYDFMFEKFVNEIAPLYSVQQIGYDPRGATQFARQLGESGFEMVEIGQGFNHMSEPSKIFEALIKAKRVRHGGHPVLRWNVTNVAVKFGKFNDILPYKPHRKKRIDGVTGAVIGIGRAMVGTKAEPKYQVMFF